MTARIPTTLLLLSFLATTAGHESTRPEEHAHEGGPAAFEDSETCRLRLGLKDAETGEALPGMVRLLAEDGTALAIPELLDRCVGLPKKYRALGWHVLAAPTEIEAPGRKVTVEATSGLERTAARTAIDLGGRKTADTSLLLRRFWSAKDRGYEAGNTHLHLKDLTREEADRYLREVSRSDGLDLVFVSYLERALVDRTYTTNAHTPGDLDALSVGEARFKGGEEYRHNFGGGGEGYGHVLFLDLAERVLPASIGPGITKEGTDAIPLRPGIVAARERGATIAWCHNGFGHEDIPSWVGGLVHAQNIFDGGNQGGYAETFYRYLDAGLRVPFSTGTDWFVYDFSRVYVRPLREDGAIDDWIEGLRAGRTFITNGPLLELTVDGARPGDVIEIGEAPVEVRFRVVGRHDFGTPEVVVGGEIVEMGAFEVKQHEGWFEAIGRTKLVLDEPDWVALRISPDCPTRNEFDRQLFGHTSPVYLQRGRESVLRREALESLRDEVIGDVARIRENADFGDGSDESVLSLYRRTIRRLEERISEASAR